MAKKLTTTKRRLIADLLSERCNYGGFPATRVDVKLNEQGDDIIVTPAEDCDPHTLFCLDEVVDIVRAFGLSLWVGMRDDRIVANIFA